MQKHKFTPFGLAVKTELLRRGMRQVELEGSITKKTGLYMDSCYMHKILTGRRKAPKVVAAICDILDIPLQQDSNPST